MKTLAYCFAYILLLSASLQAQAQQRLLKGEVRDKQGPLAGAIIAEKGVPKNQTQADVNGKFSLRLSGNTIVVRFVGYLTQEINVQGKSEVKVTLADDQAQLEEVVVVGFATQKKKTLTGSVSSISGEDIRQSPSPSLQNNLAGRITGFSSQQRSGRPGADAATFYVRGINTYASTGNNQPLIIVDDIEYTYAQFSALNANEIESISILKDAATTAIYGIKGANGVILVSTMRGKVGKPRVTFQSEYALSQPTILPPHLDAYEAAKLYNEMQINSNNLNPNPSFVPQFSEQDLELYRTGEDPYGHPNNDWAKILLRKFAPQLRNNLNVSGGTDRAKYFISIGQLDQGGQLKDFGVDLNSEFYYKRYNYRSNIDLKVNNDLDLQFNFFGFLDETNKDNASANDNIFSDLSRQNETSPFNYPIFNPDGSLGYSVWQRNAGRNNNNIVGRFMYNGYYRTFNNNINLGTTLNQKLNFITPGLSLKGTIAYRNQFFYARYLNRSASGAGFPSYVYDPKTGTYSYGRTDNVFRITTPTLRYEPGSTNSQLTTQAILNYNRTFGGSHSVTALLVYNTSSKKYQNSADANRYNFIPEVFRSYISRVGYDYKGKYLFEASAAYNGSLRFAEGHRYGLFPAASIGWNVAEEQFVKNRLPFLDQFKLRGSYGATGADNTGGVYTYLQTYTVGSGSGLFGVATNNGYPTAVEGRLPNDRVGWEIEKKMDLGLDLALFKRKLTGTISYFNNNRSNIITSPEDVSTVVGQTLPLMNLGKTNNRGWELEFGYRGQIQKDWRYSLRGTYSLARNKIVYMGEPDPIYEYQRKTGQAIGSQLKYTWTGEFYTADEIADPTVPKPVIGGRPGDIKYKDLNSDGVIDAGDQSFFGYTNLPNTTFGLTLGFGYKNFNVSALFQGATNFVASAQGAVIHHTVSKMLPIHQQHWTPELGNSAKYPQLYSTELSQAPREYYSDFWAIPGNYIRLKSAEVSYSLSPKLLERLKVKDVRIYTSGYNLLTWTKLDKLYYLDPEVVEAVTDLPYPPTRMFNFGLNVTF